MTTLKGIFPNPKPPRKKNYVQENVKSLRTMEKYFHSNKEIEKLQKLQTEKQQQFNKYQNIGPRVNSSLRGSCKISGDNNCINNNYRDNDSNMMNRKSSAPASVKGVDSRNRQHNNISNNSRRHRLPAVNLKQRKAPKNKSDIQNTNRSLPDALNLMSLHQDLESPSDSSGKPKCTNRGSQTMDNSNIDAIYSEGVIRYPSSKGQRRSSLQEKNNTKIDMNSQKDCGDMIKHSSTLSGPKENINYVKANKEIPIATKMATQLNNGILPPNYRKGAIPKYIIERKEELFNQQMEKAKNEAVNADCPDGHVPLPDNERKETLRMLQKNYEGLVNELNKLPIRSDTLRSQRRKMELEQELKKLEEGIKVFSRPKVFIKMDE
ncbi:hypothetical protein PV327_005454 [Microctonus hyperodae]|uniref:Enkurin domain-containing protein n=1 Tax=Microctonus hyperodae TaxID=165561 RepID=A0AA39G263_MICHY|nr:hypothetical protein PV327_005454 [Microctonus hyperodae]